MGRLEFFVYDYCLHWPAPRVAEPPFPAGARYPDVPTLVMNGDFDLRTDVYQAREVAANFPNATYVEVPNYGHVTSVYEVDRCPSVIVRRFVTTLDGGGHVLHRSNLRASGRARFARKAAGIPQAMVASPYDRSSANDRRAATVAVEAIADVIDRWYAIPGYSGTSLYGGRFHMYQHVRASGLLADLDVEAAPIAVDPRHRRSPARAPCREGPVSPRCR